MKIEEFEKLTKVKMTEEYKKLSQSACLGEHADYKKGKKYKDERDASREECEKLKDERDTANNEMEKRRKECHSIRKQVGVLGEEHNGLIKRIDDLEGENKQLTIMNERMEYASEKNAVIDGAILQHNSDLEEELNGIPLNQLPEDKLVVELKKQMAINNKQARKLKKLKKQKK